MKPRMNIGFVSTAVAEGEMTALATRETYRATMPAEGPPTGDELNFIQACEFWHNAANRLVALNQRVSPAFLRDIQVLQAQMRALVQIEDIDQTDVRRNSKGEMVGSKKRRVRSVTFVDRGRQ